MAGFRDDMGHGRRRRLLVALCGLLAAGSVAGAVIGLNTPSAHGGQRSRGSARTEQRASRTFSRFRSSGVSFRYPAAWTRHRGCLFTLTSGELVILTTAHFSCAGPGETVGRLSPHGVFVKWFVAHHDASISPPPIKDPDRRIDGQPARIASGPAGSSCTQIAGATTVSAELASPPGDRYTMTACIAGPDAAMGERAVSRMLSSVRFAP